MGSVAAIEVEKYCGPLESHRFENLGCGQMHSLDTDVVEPLDD